MKKINNKNIFRLIRVGLTFVLLVISVLMWSTWIVFDDKIMIYIDWERLPHYSDMLVKFLNVIYKIYPGFIALIILFFLWVKGRQLVIACFSVICVMLLAALLLVLGFNSRLNPYNNDKFNQKQWLSNYSSHTTKNPRGSMVHDLIKNYLKIGMGKNDIIKLLGMPTTVKKSELHYCLGIYSNWLDNDFLCIMLDDQELIISVKICQG